LSVPFYDFPSSPILIIGALGITVAIVVFLVAYQKYFNSPLNKEIAEKKKALIKEQKELNARLEKIEQDPTYLKIKMRLEKHLLRETRAVEEVT